MALAYLYEDESPESPWPKPQLQLVTAPAEPDDHESEDPPDGGEPPLAAVLEVPQLIWTERPGAEAVHCIRQGADVAQRRRHRASCRVARRRVAALVLVTGLLVLLALPLSVLAGRPAATVPAFAAVGQAKVTYVVQPGDTVGSIAVRFDDGASPRPLIEALEAEIGSDIVVPGEHVAIP